MRYFLGFLITIGLLILVVVMLLRGGQNNRQIITRSLTKYSQTDSQVSFVREGPVNAASLHRQIKITVDRRHVVYQEIHGYDGRVANTKTFTNTPNSYNAFLSGLERAGFTRGNIDPALANVIGRCPLGQRYIFGLDQDDKQIQRFWATSCGGQRTYLGNLNGTINLFQNQVPNFSVVSQKVVL
jgi:hypothetical protein